MGLSLIRHDTVHRAIKEEHKEHGYPIRLLCRLGGVSHAAYYKWVHRKVPGIELANQRIADEIEKTHKASPDKGDRRIRDDLKSYHGIKAKTNPADLS